MSRRITRLFLCLLALTMNGNAVAGSATFATTGVPAGFGALAETRVTLVDLYFGGKRIGSALAETRPGSIRFRSPSDVLGLIPGVLPDPELASLIASDLPTNSAALCSIGKTSGCGLLSPPALAVLYDEDRFRVDVFINPRFLKVTGILDRAYLPTPTAPLSMTSAIGVAAAGTIGGPSTYNIQNRTVIGFHNARLRSSNAIASTLGWVVDDFVGEIDNSDRRYSAGLFWAPGNDLIGERRIIGAGVATQFDTRTDADAIRGTPLILFLPQPARVEILVDGRLVSSHSYDAGNIELDTSSLAEGSYALDLRIQERGGAVREEHRFFVKNASVPPAGHPVYFAYAGVLANTRPHRPIDPSSTPFYQAGLAFRLRNGLAIDGNVIATDKKAFVELGAWFLARPARIRFAALGSTAGDAGLLVQASSDLGGILNFNFDLRRIWSGDGRPLIPVPVQVNSFGSDQPIGAQLATGTYMQAIGSLGVRLGDKNLSLLASYRKDRGRIADYSIGPSLSWPLVTRGELQLAVELSAQRGRNSTAGFAGIRFLSASRHLSVSGNAGERIERDPGDASTVSRATGNVTLAYTEQTKSGTILTADAGAERDPGSSSISAGGTVSSTLGNARADVTHALEGSSHTQYDVSLQTGLAISARSASFGARTSEPSAIIVSVDGDAGGAKFTVLVDGAPRGQVSAGEKLPLFVPGYRTYHVRLVPVEAVAVDFDAAAREVTVFPGNVQRLNWTAKSYFTLFAQLVTPKGAPIANALVQAPRGIAESDGQGFVQLDIRAGDSITAARAGEPSCTVALPAVSVHNDLASAGKVVCK